METLDCKKRKIMSQRKFSIITINYNNKEGLRKTIESVVAAISVVRIVLDIFIMISFTVTN